MSMKFSLSKILGPVSQNYLMTKICNKTKICHKIYLHKLSYLMIILRLLEILRHPNKCLKAELNMAVAYFFVKKQLFHSKGIHLQGQNNLLDYMEDINIESFRLPQNQIYNLYEHSTKRYPPLSSSYKQRLMLVTVFTVHVVTPSPWSCTVPFFCSLFSLDKSQFLLTLSSYYMLFDTYVIL